MYFTNRGESLQGQGFYRPTLYTPNYKVESYYQPCIRESNYVHFQDPVPYTPFVTRFTHAAVSGSLMALVATSVIVTMVLPRDVAWRH